MERQQTAFEVDHVHHPSLIVFAVVASDIHWQSPARPTRDTQQQSVSTGERQFVSSLNS
jgi:hypothetical protein